MAPPEGRSGGWSADDRDRDPAGRRAVHASGRTGLRAAGRPGACPGRVRGGPRRRRSGRRERSRRSGRARLGPTLAFRHHLWMHGLGVAEAMDTAQRGMGLDYPATRELIRRSAVRGPGGRRAHRRGVAHRPARARAGQPGRGVARRTPSSSPTSQDAGADAGADVQPPPRRRRPLGRRLPPRLRRADRATPTGRWSCTGSGRVFDPALAGYWGGADLDAATRPCSALIGARRHGRRDQGVAARRGRGRWRCAGRCRRACGSTPATTSTTPS